MGAGTIWVLYARAREPGKGFTGSEESYPFLMTMEGRGLN